MLPTIITSQIPFQIMTLKETTGGSKAQPILSLILGEIVDALVLSAGRDRTAALQIKNSTLIADSPFPLQLGEKLTVRVDQLRPSIVLRMIRREDADALRAHALLKLHRSNPDALKDLITFAKHLLDKGNLNELSQVLSKKDIQDISKVLDQVIITKDNVTSPLFLKDFVTALGLTDEWRLMKALSEPAMLKHENNNPTLKEILLKLSSEPPMMQAARDHAELATRQIIGQISDFADRAVTVIESLQIVNVLAQEQDGLFTIQVPFQFPDGIRMQELFIETNREKNQQDGGKRYRIVLFLEMDALGELAIDAGFQDGMIRSTFACSDENVLDYMRALLPKLREAISETGQEAGSLQCVLNRNLQSWKHDFLCHHDLFAQNTINVCA